MRKTALWVLWAVAVLASLAMVRSSTAAAKPVKSEPGLGAGGIGSLSIGGVRPLLLGR